MRQNSTQNNRPTTPKPSNHGSIGFTWGYWGEKSYEIGQKCNKTAKYQHKYPTQNQQKYRVRLTKDNKGENWKQNRLKSCKNHMFHVEQFGFAWVFHVKQKPPKIAQNRAKTPIFERFFGKNSGVKIIFQFLPIEIFTLKTRSFPIENFAVYVSQKY